MRTSRGVTVVKMTGEAGFGRVMHEKGGVRISYEGDDELDFSTRILD